MSWSGLLVFAAAYVAVVALPGPGVTAMVARVLARGTEGSAALIAGFVAGSLLWFTVAATGLAVIATTFAPVFAAIRYGGAAYLLYVAWKLWNAPAHSAMAVAMPAEKRLRLFLTGLSVNLGNPKVIVFFLALLPTVVDLRALTPLGFAELALTVAAIVAGVFTAYTVAAARARRLFTSPRAMRTVNRGSGLVVAGAALTIAAR